MLLLHHHFAKKQSNKSNLIKPISFGNFKVVFILLIKIIVDFYRFLSIYLTAEPKVKVKIRAKVEERI